MSKFLSIFACLTLSVFLVGCGDGKGDKKVGTKTPTTETTPSKGTTAPAGDPAKTTAPAGDPAKSTRS